MKVSDLIKALADFSPTDEVCIEFKKHRFDVDAVGHGDYFSLDKDKAFLFSDELQEVLNDD